MKFNINNYFLVLKLFAKIIFVERKTMDIFIYYNFQHINVYLESKCVDQSLIRPNYRVILIKKNLVIK